MDGQQSILNVRSHKATLLLKRDPHNTYEASLDIVTEVIPPPELVWLAWGAPGTKHKSFSETVVILNKKIL